MPSKITPKRTRHRNAPTPTQPEKLFSENAAKIMSRAVFVTGVFSLFSYFFHIEYFPAFDLKSAASYVSSLAYVLTILITTLALIFLIPYVMAAVFIRAKPDKKGNHKLISEIIEWMFYGTVCMCAASMCIFLSVYQEWPAERGLLLAFLVLVLISSFRAKLIKSRRARKTKQKHLQSQHRRLLAIRKPNFILGIFWAANKTTKPVAASNPLVTRRLPRRRFFTRSVWRLMLVAYRRSKPSHKARLWERRAVRRIIWRQWLGTLITGIAQFLPLSFLLLTLDRASQIKPGDYTSFIMVGMEYALCVSFVGGILLYLALSPAHRKSWHWGLSLALSLPLMLNLMSQASGMLPMAVMQVTKNGNFRAEKLILSAKACEGVAPILGIDCDAKSSKPIELCNVHVMTRVGPETYLRLPDKKADRNGKHRVQRVFVPTADIVALEVNFELKFLQLAKLDENLAELSPQCISELTTLYGDSAFKFDDFTLTDLGKKQLSQMVQAIKSSPRNIKEIVITGYADQIGTKPHNAWLSSRRATEVRLFMERELRNTDAVIPLIVDAKGSANPLIEDCGKAKDRIACEAPNRRVELRIIKKEITAITR